MNTLFLFMATQSHKKTLLIDLNIYSSLNTTERNAYSFYISLMLKFNNNQIYKATNKRLSELTGIHRNSISKYILILKKHFLIRYIAENLQIITLKPKKRLFKLVLYRSLSAQKVKELIEIEILRLNINKQIHNIYIKKLSRSKQTKKSNKILRTVLKKNPNILDSVYDKDIHFSYRYASQNLKVSTGKIQALLKSASNNYIIRTEKVYKFIKKIETFAEFKTFKNSLNKFSDVFINLKYDFKTKKCFQLVGTDIRFNLLLT